MFSTALPADLFRTPIGSSGARVGSAGSLISAIEGIDQQAASCRLANDVDIASTAVGHSVVSRVTCPPAGHVCRDDLFRESALVERPIEVELAFYVGLTGVAGLARMRRQSHLFATGRRHEADGGRQADNYRSLLSPLLRLRRRTEKETRCSPNRASNQERADEQDCGERPQ